MNKAEYLRQELKKELARRSFSDYCQYVNGEEWILGKHLELVCGKVEDLIYRRVKQNILVISMPPQHGKSQCVTETLPSFHLGKFPNKRIIEVSYGDDLARKFGRRNKQKIEQHGKDLFKIELSKNSRSDTEFEIEGYKGSMISRGIMAGITGQPGDLILIDDPIKNRKEAESDTYRQNIWEEFLNSIYTRLSANGVIILIMTRWHEDDLAGKLLKEMPDKCLEINIPLEAEDNDILGRKPGDSLFPEIGKNNDWLADFKLAYLTSEGSRTWNALMQGRPTALEGNLFKRHWFKYYEVMPEKFDQVLQSWDCTFKNSDGSDYVVGTVWGRKGPNKYLLDLVRARMDFPETVRAILNTTLKWPTAYTKLIEDKANGSAIIQVLNQKLEGIMPITPKESKLARAQSILGQVECGNVYLPKNASWVENFIEECCSFPSGKHDDQVDSMTQALSKMTNNYTLPEEEKKLELPFALQTDEIDFGGEYISW